MAPADARDKAETKAPAPARRGFPLLPTLTVALAVPLMLGLGVWQYQRHLWKDALLADYAANHQAPLLDIGHGSIPANSQFRHVAIFVTCPDGRVQQRGGSNQAGAAGFAHLLSCSAGNQPLRVDIGWSARPQDMRITGFTRRLRGQLMGSANEGWTLFAAEAIPPLEVSAPPAVQSIPNNHLSYAFQWWSFATVLAIIYGIWLRRWLAPGGHSA